MRRAAAFTTWRSNGAASGRSPSSTASRRASSTSASMRSAACRASRASAGRSTATRSGGTLYLNTQNANVELPLLFGEKLALDVLTAQVAWQRKRRRVRDQAQHRGVLESRPVGQHLGQLPDGRRRARQRPTSPARLRAPTRAACRATCRCRFPSARASGWGRRFPAAPRRTSSCACAAISHDFPFPEGRGGLFEVIARVNGGVLDYATGLAAHRKPRGRPDLPRAPHGRARARGHHTRRENRARARRNSRRLERAARVERDRRRRGADRRIPELHRKEPGRRHDRPFHRRHARRGRRQAGAEADDSAGQHRQHQGRRRLPVSQ